MKTILSLLAGLIVLALAIISVQNPTLITLRFLGWQTAVLPLWVVIVAALTCGMALVGLLAVPGRIQRYRTTRQLRHQLADADTTIASLDHQPAVAANAAPADRPAGAVPAASSQDDDFWGPSRDRELPGMAQKRHEAQQNP